MLAVTTTLKEMSLDTAAQHVSAGAALIDLREIGDYLDAHIPGSICLQYEFGPGFPVRARDCIPLEVPLVLLARADVDMPFAAASLRGKGFAVLGRVEDGINSWVAANGNPASTETITGGAAPGGTLLNVGDPGAEDVEGPTVISVERLWTKTEDLPTGAVVVIAGKGVRAALAVGMLERAGRTDILFWTPGGPRP
jgi:rhodanese-related sulfurtransferase